MDGGTSQGDEIPAKHFALALSFVCLEILERCHSFVWVLRFDCDVVVVPEDDGGFGSADAVAAGSCGSLRRWAFVACSSRCRNAWLLVECDVAVEIGCEMPYARFVDEPDQRPL